MQVIEYSMLPRPIESFRRRPRLFDCVLETHAFVVLLPSPREIGAKTAYEYGTAKIFLFFSQAKSLPSSSKRG